MDSGNIVGGIYRISEWIMKLAYLSFLWLTISLLGLILFTVVPSTVAMFAITRKWLMGEDDVPILRTFWKIFREEFFRSNLVALVMVLIGLILYFDLRFFQSQEGIIFQGLSMIFIFLILMYFVVLLFLFPVYVHYQFPTLHYIKYSFFIAITNPFELVFMILVGSSIYYTFASVSAILIFLGASTLSTVLMWCAMKAFQRTEKKARSEVQIEKETEGTSSV